MHGSRESWLLSLPPGSGTPRQILKAIPPGVAESNAKEIAKKLIAPVDPITYADQLKKRNLLMIAASKDDIVPPAAAKALWEATGKQKIVWLNTTHVGAALYLFDATEHIVKHFK